MLPLRVSSAFKIAGSSFVELHVDDGADDLGNFAGDVGLDAFMIVCLLERFGARNDFDEFFW